MSNSLLEIKEFRHILENSGYAVFFGGAGVSTDSGIPDFRGPNGLYKNKNSSAEYLLSRECLKGEPELFFKFYREKMLYPNAIPNKTHTGLAELEAKGILKAVITQNIDGLHQKAGSQKVIELHGSTNRHYCMRCGKLHDKASVIESENIPRCACGGIIRPDVTIYGEPLDNKAFFAAQNEIEKADVLIVGGSSLTVQPAASLVGNFCGNHLVIINYTQTPYDSMANCIIRDSISNVFSQIIGEL